MKNPKTRGATKVPNVKLRPAQPSSSRKAQGHLPRVELLVDDTTQGDFDFESGNKPFKGIVLCATGSLDKRTLFSRAQELGAIRANDFTDQVTHLVADVPGSAKYRCAVERRLPILRESWVEEAYSTWLSGETVDLEKITAKHRLPIFTGVRLCLTGLDDLDMRGKIHSLLAKEGGMYLKSLDKTVTHLLACASEESPKLKWASDYNEKTRSDSEKISIVWEEWFWDSLEFGGLWDEREYVITNPHPSRKLPSEVPRSMDRISGENSSSTATHSRPIPLPSSLPTSVLLGEDTPEFGSVKKVPHARQILFDRIFSRREKEKDIPGAKDSDVSQSASCSLLESATQHEEIEGMGRSSKTHEPSSKHHAEIDSVLTRLANHRMNSFVGPSEARQPFRRIVSSNSSIAREPQESSSGDHSTSNEDKVSSLFEGYNFRAFGEAKSDNLRNALISHGGGWLADDQDEEASFLIVRLVSGEMYWRAEADYAERAKYRTECWIERCIFEERICSAEEHVVFTPLKIDIPVRGSEKLHVGISGLDTAEACWVKRLIRAIGGNLVNTFSRHSTHLICPSGRGAKFDKANEWGVCVVGTEWLTSIAMTGEIPDAKLFPVHPKVEEGFRTDIVVKQDINGKAKVKEAGKNEEMIVDITNEIPEDRPPSKPQNSSYTYPDKLQTNTISSESPRTRSINGSTNAESELRFGQTVGLQSRQLSTVAMEVAPPSPPRFVPSPSSPLKSQASKKANRTSQPFSAVEVPLDRHMTLIPSSHSPSPLEIPSKSATVSSPPISEIRGLKTAITALLGKRSADSQDTTIGPVQKRQGRVGKRPRPSSRKKTNLEPRRGPSPALYLLSGSSSFSRPPVHEDSELVSEEAQPDLGVVYEDPDQRAEKKRLIALFEGGSMLDGSEIGGDDCENFITPAGVEGARSTMKRKSVRKTAKSSGG